MADNEIDKTVAQYKNFDQLQDFAQALHLTNISLTKKIKKLEEEKKHLKELAPISQNLPTTQDPNKFLVSSTEVICTVQLDLLREISLARELTLEEAKRVEIFSKVLASEKNKPKDLEIPTKKMSDEELLKLAAGSEEK